MVVVVVVMFSSTDNILDVQVVLKDYTQTCTIVALEGEGRFFFVLRGKTDK